MKAKDATPAVRVENLSKIFTIWKRPSDVIMEAITGRQRHTEFVALRDVSFEVPRGSIVGILGRNGAGKSTLLRIIAGTLDSSAGRVEVNGRIAAILELGTGFHPEYSGRENVFLGGMCLGLSRAEIKSKFDEIVEFSELEDFIDQPFRTYSSGMQARLTFAVATSVDPDILIVDEALSVGDARFALKSFDRIRQFARANKSILFVSHDINQVMTFCDEALMLENGQVYARGDPREVGNCYHQRLFGKDTSQLIRARETREAVSAPAPQQVIEGARMPSVSQRGVEVGVAPSSDPVEPRDSTEVVELLTRLAQPGHREQYEGDQKAVIEAFKLCDGVGKAVVQLDSLEIFECVVALRAKEDVDNLVVGVLIRDQRGVALYSANSLQPGRATAVSLAAGEVATVRATFNNNLAPGHYFASLLLARDDAHIHDLKQDVLEFVVAAAKGVYTNSLVNLAARIRFEELATELAI